MIISFRVSTVVNAEFITSVPNQFVKFLDNCFVIDIESFKNMSEHASLKKNIIPSTDNNGIVSY